MSKILLTYSSFGIACLVVIVAFITTTTYIQLAVAVLLYPLLVFFAYKIFPLTSQRSPSKKPETTQPPLQKVPSHPAILEEKVTTTKTYGTGISDIDKRTFLKLLGATGISFFLISIFGRRVESLLFGQNQIQTPASTGNPPGGVANTALASPTEGYTISEIDDGLVSYYGFINKEGNWFIMKGDSDTGSFRYAKGELNFPSNWKNRAQLKYDYFYKVFS